MNAKIFSEFLKGENRQEIMVLRGSFIIVFFFYILGQDLADSFNVSYNAGEMSISQRRGVKTLIPKEDSDLSSLNNWRPITLLNLDYKIASKVIAKRIEKVLSLLVSPDQTGFIKGLGTLVKILDSSMTFWNKQESRTFQVFSYNWIFKKLLTQLNGILSKEQLHYSTSGNPSNVGFLPFTLIPRVLS